jgi:hypothetical protein
MLLPIAYSVIPLIASTLFKRWEGSLRGSDGFTQSMFKIVNAIHAFSCRYGRRRRLNVGLMVIMSICTGISFSNKLGLINACPDGTVVCGLPIARSFCGL